MYLRKLHAWFIDHIPAQRFVCPVMGSLNFANCTFSDADFSWLGILTGNIAQFVQGSGC